MADMTEMVDRTCIWKLFSRMRFVHVTDVPVEGTVTGSIPRLSDPVVKGTYGSRGNRTIAVDTRGRVWFTEEPLTHSDRELLCRLCPLGERHDLPGLNGEVIAPEYLHLRRMSPTTLV